MADFAEADTAAMNRLRGGDDLTLHGIMTRWQQPRANYLPRFYGDGVTAHDRAQEIRVRLARWLK